MLYLRSRRTVDQGIMLNFSQTILYLCVTTSHLLPHIQGLLIPEGNVTLDCKTQGTFSCDVTGINSSNFPVAGWTIKSLHGIDIIQDTGTAAADNPRITTNTKNGSSPLSVINITDFTTKDDGGIVKCVNTDDGAVHGVARVGVGSPSCPSNIMGEFMQDCTRATLTWDQPSGSPVTSTVVTYCPASSPNCGNSVTCTSPCDVRGLDPTQNDLTDPGENYVFQVIPENNCGPTTGCEGMVIPPRAVPDCVESVNVKFLGGETCPRVVWTPSDNDPVLRLLVKYSPPSADGRSHQVCELPNLNCTIEGLESMTRYSFNVTPINNCGHPTSCTMNMVQVRINNSLCVEVIRDNGMEMNHVPNGAIIGGTVGGLALVILIAVIIVIVVFFCIKSRSNFVKGSQLYSTPIEKPKQGNEKDEQQEPPVNHKEGPATDLYAMPDKEKDVLHTTSAGPVTEEENAVASEPKTNPGS